MTTTTDLATLCRRAYADYGARALWNLRVIEHPTPEEAMVIANRLRVEGNMQARSLAEEIERTCRAAL